MKHVLRRGGVATLVCLSLSGSAVATSTLTLPEVLNRLRVAPEQLEVEAALAAVEQQIAETSGRLLQGPTVELGAGSRRAVGSNSGDLDVSVDIPLLARAGSRNELAQALDSAAPALRAFAEAQARAAAATAYVDAWEAQRLEALRKEALALHDHWLRVAQERAAAGSLAGYEVSLLRAERATTAGLLTEAVASTGRAWAVLAAMFEVDTSDASALPTLSPAAPASSAASREARSRSSLALEAVHGRAALERALAGLTNARERSRWSLRPGWAQEGDEDVARLGVSWRLPRTGESASSDRRTDSLTRRIERQAELDAASIGARRQAAGLLAETLVDQGAADDLRAAGAAIEARWMEGKSGLAEILPLRRQLLASAEAELGRRAVRARAEIEWHLLTQEMER